MYPIDTNRALKKLKK